MSKYARTRKAICRISGLKEWPITRKQFKKNPPRTWKQDYKEFRKRCLFLKQLTGMSYKYYSHSGKAVFPPCQYKEALRLFTIWRLPL